MNRSFQMINRVQNRGIGKKDGFLSNTLTSVILLSFQCPMFLEEICALSAHI